MRLQKYHLWVTTTPSFSSFLNGNLMPWCCLHFRISFQPSQFDMYTITTVSVWTIETVINSCDDFARFPCLNQGCLSNVDLCYRMHTSVWFSGRSINMKSAGIIGRNGPQSKQPFLVAFFKASEVLLRSVRATGSKKKSHNKHKSRTQQKSPPAIKGGGKKHSEVL